MKYCYKETVYKRIHRDHFCKWYFLQVDVLLIIITVLHHNCIYVTTNNTMKTDKNYYLRSKYQEIYINKFKMMTIVGDVKLVNLFLEI